jgi:hypothetical protein
MSERMIKTLRIYQLLILDKEFVDWLDRQTNKTKDKVINLITQFLFCIVLSIYSCIHIYLHIFGDTYTNKKFKHVIDGFPIQFKVVKRLIMSDDFWDTLKVDTQVLQPSLVALHYCDDMKGDTLALLHSLLFELDTTYSKPIKGLDETILTNLYNVQ